MLQNKMLSNMDPGQSNDFSLYRATGSPELIRNLSRHRDRFEKDMVAMNNRLLTCKMEYNKKFVAQGTMADITEIEDRMAQVLVMYSQQQWSGTGNDSTSMCDQLHQEWFERVRTAKQGTQKMGKSGS